MYWLPSNARNLDPSESPNSGNVSWMLYCICFSFVSLGNQEALFACDFESLGSKSFCGWNIDPRDNGAKWTISTDSNLSTNMLCLVPSTLPETYFNGDDSEFGPEGSDESVMRAKFWSPKFRAAKSDMASMCIKFSFKFVHAISDQQSVLSVMRHSVR